MKYTIEAKTGKVLLDGNWSGLYSSRFYAQKAIQGLNKYNYKIVKEGNLYGIWKRLYDKEIEQLHKL